MYEPISRFRKSVSLRTDSDNDLSINVIVILRYLLGLGFYRSLTRVTFHVREKKREREKKKKKKPFRRWCMRIRDRTLVSNVADFIDEFSFFRFLRLSLLS